ncbi:MAG: cell division protein FtsQ/DivIB [Roseitalea sp.]|nr:cell division protein FtsQ/DivIB [Roseitalea sp.]MBO6722564.1 cell division protein FtsQ/DivIB [Roseitalea sp.]MBO6742339.1 cell division protein FtsQ/DivIB [Roseitalea sp.]
MPPRTETMLFGAVIGGAILYGSVLGGQFGRTVEQATAAMGFAVEEIELSGNTYTPVDDVFAALGLDGRRSLVSIEPVAARASLTDLPWIASARIAKVYPSKLVVEVGERAPFAVWQTGEALSVIELDGTVIGGYAAHPRLAALPLLVGKGAAETGAGFVATVQQYPAVADRVRAHIRVGQRRWDLRLDNGITIRLPETGVERALERLVTMQDELDVFGRDLAAIDMRFEDRTLFALTGNALDARKALIEAREDARERTRRGNRI